MSQPKIDEITIHTESFVKGFFGDYRWLSNYHVCEIHYEGLIYTSTEAAYQSAKTLDSYTRQRFTELSPQKSRNLGQEIIPRKDWNEVKL